MQATRFERVFIPPYNLLYRRASRTLVVCALPIPPCLQLITVVILCKSNKTILINLHIMKKYLLFILILNSCTANYHLRKFISKGGKIDTTTITTTLHDTLHLKGRDSIITREIQIKCPEPKAPETRYETRWKYKTKIDSLKTVRYITKWKTKEIVKVARQENKREWWLLAVGALLGIVGMLIIRK